MSILARYLNRLLVLRFVMVLGGLVLVVLSLDLMETSDNVVRSARGELVAPILRYALLRLPDLTAKLLPVAALLAAILTLVELSRNRETSAIWSTGVSPLRLILAVLPAGLLFGSLQAALDNWAAPKGLQELYAWGVGPYTRESSTADTRAVWLRVGGDILRIPSGAAQSGDLKNVIIFRRDARGMLVDKLLAQEMNGQGDSWLLEDVTRWTTDGKEPTQLGSMAWQGELNLEGLALLAGEPRELTFRQLKDLIARDAYGQRSVDLYETWLHFRFVSATAPTFMVVLSLAIAYWLGAAASIARLFISALALGFAFFIFSQTALAMGKVGLLPPWLAAWAPVFCLTCLIVVLLLRREPTHQSARPRAAPSG
ncbi:MAG: LptF/LptG family permease [Kiloniellales bacterium]|nr:LptF/LptG family permease [Kiloniellales bacterium]